MSAASPTRRAAAEIEGQAALYRIGTHSIHQFWHLFAAHFRHVLLAPQRRPDSGRVAWTWREETENRPVTATELTEVRRRLSESNRSLVRGFDLDPGDESASGAEKLEGQVRAAVNEMVAQLVAQRDAALSAFVCRTDAGLMMHSWGASAAAKPFFPDAQNGEISGNVVIGAERPPGVTVALENAQGTVLMRVQSERDGAFHFSNVAPGNYRLRVLDRREFPADGVAVTMERESITGLELRGTLTDSPAEIAPVAFASESTQPWHQRRWVGVAALLCALGIGGWIWNSARTSSELTSKKTRDSSWQSASGQLPGGDGKNVVRDDRKVGNEGAFSSLSSSSPPPKITTPAHGPRDSAGRKIADGASRESPDSNAKSTDPDQKKQNPDIGSKVDPRSTSPTLAKQTVPSPSLSSGKSPADNPPEVEVADDEGKSGEVIPSAEKLAAPPHRIPDNKRPDQLGSKPAPTEESSSTPSLATGSEATPDLPTQGAMSSTAGAARKSSEKKGSSQSRVNVGSPSTAVDSAEDAQGLSESTKNNAPASSDKMKRDRNPPASSSVAPSNEASRPATDAQPVTSDAAVLPDDATASNSADQNSPSNAGAKKPSRSNAGAQLSTGESPATNGGATDTEAGNDPDKKTVNPGASPSKKNPGSTKSSNTVAAPATGTPADTANPAGGTGDDDSNSNPNRTGKSGKKSRPSVSPPSEPGQESERTEENPVTKIPAGASDARVKSDDASLVLIGKLRASTWKVRLAQDLIIPTRPLTVREEEQVAVLRKKLQEERTARMPQSFQHPRIKSGVTLEFDAVVFAETEKPQWRDEQGKAVAASSAHGRMAELEWEGSTPPAGRYYLLSARDGKTLARVEVDQTGSLTLKTSPATRIGYWVGIETGSLDAPVPRALEWRLSTGEPVPSTWPRDDAWLAGRGRRIEIPLDATSIRNGHYGIGLVDPDSGWALAGDIMMQ